MLIMYPFVLMVLALALPKYTTVLPNVAHTILEKLVIQYFKIVRQLLIL